MKVVPLIALALALSSLTLGFIFAGSGWPVVLGGGLAGLALGSMWGGGAVSRDTDVRKLVVVALEADANVVNAKLLAEVLGTPDVLHARKEHLRREAAVLAQRYANGDSSDH